MAILNLTKTNEKISSPEKIVDFLSKFNITYETWTCDKELLKTSSQEEILEAYAKVLKPFMAKFGYKTADVINVSEITPNIGELRKKFLAEHTHSEDEVRFFVDGEGLFWFNLDGNIISLLCQKGDLILVPKNYKHWFDMGTSPFVKCIRIFTDPNGWVANYTNSKIDQEYNPKYD